MAPKARKRLPRAARSDAPPKPESPPPSPPRRPKRSRAAAASPPESADDEEESEELSAAVKRGRRAANAPGGAPVDITPSMALPKGKSLAGMQSLRKRVEETSALNELPNEEGTVVGDAYGERVRALLGEVDGDFSLDPEAEELVLKMADEFVHRVTRRAAEYAKHRRSATLDAVDVQLCLEKHWNIAVPGIPTGTPARPAALAEPFRYERVDASRAAPPPPAKGGGRKRKAAAA